MPWFSPSVEMVERRILSAWRRGDAEGQERIAANYARRRPDEPRAWVLWGNVRVKTGNFSGAETALREGLRLHPSADPDLGWLLARALTAQDREQEGTSVLEEQMRVFPWSRLPYLGLLTLAVRRRDWDEAVRLADETAARTPDDDYAGKHELAYELLHIPSRWQDGLSLLRPIAADFQEPGPTLLLVGTVLERIGDPEATRFIDQARKAWDAPIPFETALAEERSYLEEHLPA
jgi:tetratricopeptide (TPR) repeat protein